VARILLVGHGQIATGFARVIESLLKSLAGDFDLHHLVVNQDPVTQVEGWTSHGNSHLPDLRSPQALIETAGRVRPDLVFLLDVPWTCASWLDAIREQHAVLPVVVYCAIDGRECLTPKITSSLARSDAIVVFTRFALSLFLESAGNDCCGRLAVIPHGVDLKTFYPLCGNGEEGFSKSRKCARAALFADRFGEEDSFIVLNANRNQPWKGIAACIEGFSLFAKGKPTSVKLYLHMGSRQPSPGTLPLVDHFGVRDRLLCTANTEQHPEVSTEVLNLIYNACEVGINTSDKEGWGLVSFEHAATGAAQVVPGHSAPVELWRNAALMLDTEAESRRVGYRKTGRPVTACSVASSLEQLYEDPSARTQWALSAYQNALQPKYRWENIANEWRRVFSDILEN
jgi:glycosyltransferase involved in cell wall biosynthesis